MAITALQVSLALAVALLLTCVIAKAFEVRQHSAPPTLLSDTHVSQDLMRQMSCNPSCQNAPPQACTGMTPYDRVEGCSVQVGTISNAGRVLPLIQTELLTRRWRYKYHTMTDSNLPMKVAVSSKGRDCLESLGCEEVYSDDTVTVPSLTADAQWTVYLYQKY